MKQLITESFAALTLLGIAVATAAAIPTIKDAGEISSPQIVELPSDNGPIEAKIYKRKFTLMINAKNSEHRIAALVIVPSREIFWLGYDHRGGNDYRQFFVISDQIVGVSTWDNDVLNIYVSAERVPDGNVADIPEKIFRSRFGAVASKDFDAWRTPFRMESVLGDWPFTHRPSAQGEPAPRITKISVDPGKFTLTFGGGEKSAVEATITFGSDFRPISATLEGKQVYPK
jgi:hypothetical protein